MTRIKRSTLAGSWYADGPEELREQVDGLLRPNTEFRSPSAVSLSGIVVPHAGYRYSGRAAAAAYCSLGDGGYERAVILAPSHFAAFAGGALLDIDAFETPLGQVAVDVDAVRQLAGHPSFRVDPQPYEPEHSLEIQLPLLQRALPKACIVPVLLGSVRPAERATLADGLAALADARTIFIVSSDFVHYGWRFEYVPFPAAGLRAVREGLRELDMGAIVRVCAGDASRFDAYVAATGATICGRVPISTFLSLHQQRTPGELLAYYTSLDVTQDFEHCVSYASIAFPRPS